MIVLKIAFRNLLEHKTKTAIIGFLIAFAIAFLVAGNSLMDSVKAGMRTSYSANYTGDLIVHGVSEEDFSLIPVGPATVDIPILPAFSELRAAAEASPLVAAVLPLISGSASLSIDEETVGLSFLWGVDFTDYERMFPDSLRFVEGGFPSDSGAFVILSETVRDDAEKEVGKKIRIGDKVTLGGFGAAGSRLREATVAGVFSFERGGAQLDRVSIVDAGTLRSLKGMGSVVAAAPVAGTNSVDGTGTGTEIATEAAFSEDDLFGSGDLLASEAKTETESNTATTRGPMETGASVDTGFTSAELDSILGDVSVRDKYSVVDSSAWNFLLVRTADTGSISAVKKSMETEITRAGVQAEVSDWRWGAGLVADLAFSIQIVFNAIVLIVSIVVVIIIMNTLVISVTERIPEIGTIRAIGGRTGFVRSMIVWETLSISVVFGLVGMLIGTAAIVVSGLVGLHAADNMFLQLLFGGSVLRPGLSTGALAWSIAATAVIGTLSSLYPTSVALKISPVKAMQKG